MKKIIVFMFLKLLFHSLISNGQTSEIFATKDGALQGYDVIAYFTEKKPVKGKKEITTSHAGQGISLLKKI